VSRSINVVHSSRQLNARRSAHLSPHTVCKTQGIVKAEARRQGYGTAMLAALEDVLAAGGWSKLRFNVYDTNEAGRRLYERAGYTLVERFGAMRQLHKPVVAVT
jgi:GNAT superfamily N-acetyltransferase